MDYIWIGIRTFTYVIIFTLIKIIVPKLLGNVNIKRMRWEEPISLRKRFLISFRDCSVFTVLLSF